MSGRDKFGGPPGAVRSFMEKLKRTVSDAQDETKNTLNQGYRRVETAESTLSTSTTATSLDQFEGHGSELQSFPQRSFSPIIETESSDNQFDYGATSVKRQSSIKESKVSFNEEEEDDHFSGDDNFNQRRHQFQQRKTKSVDHKGILKDLRHILENDNRRQFQSKKHVSLDINNTKHFEDLLKGSSSEEDFPSKRADFQARKHQSLDSRVTFKLDKEPTSSSSSDDEFENRSLIQFVDKYDITKPVIIDFKDLPSSDEDEDFISNRKSFQKSKSLSLDSRKSRFYEMDEIRSMKGDNIRKIVPFVRQITEEGKPKLEVYRPTTNPIYIYTQVLAALSVSLGSLSVGFSSAYSSPATESMYNRNITNFEVTKDMGSWVGGIMPLAGLIGGVLGGPLIEYLGRKTTILATAVPFMLSWLLIGFAIDISMVLSGRFLSGLCVGIASLSLPVYLGETVQPEVRGTLGLLPTAFGNIGILLCFTAGRYLNWDHLAFFGGVLPIPFLILMVMIPETPRWHVGHGSEDKARKALQWLRGKQADVEPELKGIVKSHTEAERHAAGNPFMELIKVKHLKPLSISLGLMFFQQLSGINAVIFFSQTIFKESGSTIDESLCSIMLGVVNFLATFVATALIDSLGRKILLYISSVAMVITLGMISGFMFAKDSYGIDVTNIGWLPLASLIIYVLGFSVGFGPIPWLMMGEILPAKIRGTAASVATGFNWSITFLVTKTFGTIAAATGYHGAFAIFCVICFIGLFFVIFCVPETQGKTLEDIERKMMGRVRRMSSVANIKPLSFNM